ncbi:MAG: protein-L-isoaspartate(D-aspartate) O-methyltransferase [Desulfosudaceae bacterium]
MTGSAGKFFYQAMAVVIMAIMTAVVVAAFLPGAIAASADKAAMSDQGGQPLAGNDSEVSFQDLKKKMIANQLVPRGITDAGVLQAFKQVDRHRYVPGPLRHLAYQDRPLPIGQGQTISQPYIVAFMTQALDLDSTDRVLEIGTGSGYQAAILAEIVEHVYTIEIVESLGRRAEQTLDREGYTNISVRIGDGYQGWPEQAPFDAIMVTCSPSDIPEPLKEQLAEGGTIIIPVSGSWGQKLILLEKQDDKLVEQKSLPVRFVPMVNEDGKSY